MGQKVNPVGLRLSLTQDWQSRWYAGKQYRNFLAEDLKIREYIGKKMVRAGISRVDLERTGDNIEIDIFTARPGVVIGRKGQEVDQLRAKLEKMTKKQAQIDIQEIKVPETEAPLVAQSVAEQLEARVSFRRAMKKAVNLALRNGAQGIRISCAGRLGGVEMRRSEWYREGKVPLHTLRANIDYGFALARTKFGAIGVKVWVNKGEISSTLKKKEAAEKDVAAKKSKTPQSATG